MATIIDNIKNIFGTEKKQTEKKERGQPKETTSKQTKTYNKLKNNIALTKQREKKENNYYEQFGKMLLKADIESGYEDDVFYWMFFWMEKPEKQHH